MLVGCLWHDGLMCAQFMIVTVLRYHVIDMFRNYIVYIYIYIYIHSSLDADLYKPFLVFY